MKIKAFLLLCFVSIIVLNAKANAPQAKIGEFTDAVDFNEFVVNLQNKIGEKVIILVASFQKPETTKETALENLRAGITVSESAINTLRETEPFPSGEAFKTAALDLFTFYNETFRLQYPEIINILFKESPSLEDQKRLDAIFVEVQAAEAAVDEKYTKAQAEFAEKNDFKLKDNSFQEQFKEK